MSIRPGRAKGPFVGSAGGGGGGTTFSSGQGLNLSGGVLNASIAAFRDDFNTEKPFWQGTQVLTSGYWDIDTANEWMIGIGAASGADFFRFGVEGDFDYAAKITQDDAGSNPSHGFNLEAANGDDANVFIAGSTVYFTVTGKSDITTAELGSTQWIRIVRFGNNHIAAYHKLNDGDSWILIGEHTDVDLGHNVKVGLSRSLDSKYHQVIFYDNMISEQIKSTVPKAVYSLSDAANISVDAAISNKFTVTLTADRTLENPTNLSPGQFLLFRVEQDGTGGHSLSFDSKYNFSSSLPAPSLSSSPNAYDYLGFVYNAEADTLDYIAEVKGF